MKLDVFYGSKKAGELSSTENHGVVFSYTDDYLSDKNSKQLSISLPLVEKEFSQKECFPFFAGLLPEEDYRKKIADYFHVSETSTLKLLEALGGECAGLITVTGEENPVLPKEEYDINSENYEELTKEQIYEFVRRMKERPLVKADEKLRLSLAGAQEKLSLAKIEGKWFLPINGAPSTHIIKPTREGSLSSLADNEYICMKLAKLFGLSVPEVEIEEFSGKKTFIASRYDRNINGSKINRIHQEDFCQALGLMSDRKYESDRGPGIFDLYGTIQNHFSRPIIDERNILKYFVFNYLIGNCDAHGKNYSILYKDGLIQLSPIYDCVSTAIYSGLTNKLSMKIGRHFELNKVDWSDFEKVAEKLQLKVSVFENIFSDIKKQFSKVHNKLLSDNQINKELCNQILDGIKKRLEILH